MSIHLDLIDLEKEFFNLKTTPIMINDFDLTTVSGKEKMMEILHTRYDGESLESIPSCSCKEVSGRFNLGIVCDNCKTPVTTIIDSELECSVWVKVPDDIIAFFNPDVWMKLKYAFTTKKCKFSLMDWLCDSHYHPSSLSDVLSQIPTEWPRSLNFVIKNFDSVMDYLFNLPGMNKKSVRLPAFKKNDFLREYLKINRDKIFTRFMPFPSRSMFIIEKNSMGKLVDNSVCIATDAILTIASLNQTSKKMDQRSKEHRVVKYMDLLYDYYYSFLHTDLGGKPGIARKLIFGGRTSWSGRAVISSLTDVHKYDEVHLCWGVAVQLFEVHLRAKLIDRGYSAKEMDEIFFTSVNIYNPLIDELFNELINEGPHPPTILFQRNPTLTRGSAIRVFVTKIEKDTSIKTNSISILSIKMMNGDFDGDETNIILILDEYSNARLSRLDPHLTLMSLNRPNSISIAPTIPVPIMNMLNNWIEMED